MSDLLEGHFKKKDTYMVLLIATYTILGLFVIAGSSYASTIKRIFSK